MKTKNYIEDPHLKENPYTVPAGYFDEMRSRVAESISAPGVTQKTGIVAILRPQIALVSAFAIIFFIGYAAYTLFTPSVQTDDATILAADNQYIDEGFLKTTFIDFFDPESDSQKEEIYTIPADQVVTYLSDNIDIITLSSLE